VGLSGPLIARPGSTWCLAGNKLSWLPSMLYLLVGRFGRDFDPWLGDLDELGNTLVTRDISICIRFTVLQRARYLETRL